MYAIVKTGGKQYRVERGQSLLIERLPESDGSTVALQPLLYVDGSDVLDGDALSKVKISARIVGHERGPKLRVVKFKPKRGYKRRTGHRQELTRIEVTEINLGSGRGSARSSAKASAEASEAAAAKAPTPVKAPAPAKAPTPAKAPAKQRASAEASETTPAKGPATAKASAEASETAAAKAPAKPRAKRAPRAPAASAADGPTADPPVSDPPKEGGDGA
jgi:large subunit ribosomal protein L21